MNFLFLDVETTGLYADKHDIVQLACVPLINNKTETSFNEFCQPLNWNSIQDEALRVHGITRDRMKTFQDPKDMLDKFINYAKSFNTKFIIAGYNVGFDKRFLSSFFTKHGRSEEFFEIFDINVHDVFARAKSVKSQLPTENLKLETLAKHYGIEIVAHDALSDILATVGVDKEIGALLGEDMTSYEAVEAVSVSTEFKEVPQLHLHSVYGMAETVASIEEWSDFCEENNVPGFSIVDNSVATSLFSMVPSKEQKSTRVPGMGLFIDFFGNGEMYGFSAWAMTTEGYNNLTKLSSIAYEDVREIDGVDYAVLTPEQVSEYSAGIIFGTGDVYSGIGSILETGDIDKARFVFEEGYKKVFRSLVAEINPVSVRHKFTKKTGFQAINRNNIVVDGDLNKAYNNFILSMSQKHSMKCIPVSGAHFINPEDKIVQDCISKNVYNSGRCYSESLHFKNSKELYVETKQQLGDRVSEEDFAGWIENAIKMVNAASKIELSFDFHLPEIEIPNHIKEKYSDYNTQTYYYLLEKCKEHGRFNDSPEYMDRFNKEIDVIKDNKILNFIPYFLLYEDICSYARDHGILQGIGRGSAGGSLISYYLKIIQIDPIKADLPFERFLSHARIEGLSFPDIDQDFGTRDKIVHYVEEKYGLGYAQICTMQTFKVKNAIKDAAMALRGRNRNDFEINQVCKSIPDSPQGISERDFLYGYVDKEGIEHTGVLETNEMLRNFFDYYPDIKNVVDKLIGIPRSFGRHASAYVISTLDLSHGRCPIMLKEDRSTGEKVRVTQFEASMVEKRGLVKADILGVTTIQAISDAMGLIKERTGIDYLEEDDNGVAKIFRLDDVEGVYVDFYNKKTDSSFQFNTGTVKNYITDFAPTSREDLAVITALLRPGAMDSKMINDEVSEEDNISATQYYVDVKNGKRRLSYVHEDLKPFTSSGVIVYQEQVMKFLVDFAGYTLEEADQVRAAIAKKKRAVMLKAFDKIREVATQRGWTKQQMDTVCDTIESFSRYSFNRSHSRCYAELGYITMYLKHKYPLEWWTATLNVVNDGKKSKSSEEKLNKYVSLVGDRMVPPSIQLASNKFVIRKDKIMCPLSVIKGVGSASVNEIVVNAPFASIEDWVDRINHTKVNIGHFSALIKARAVDDLMDQNKSYADAKKELLETYLKKRKRKSGFKEELFLTDPLSLFLMEKEANQCFGKTLLNYPGLNDVLKNKWPALRDTGREGIPFLFGEKSVPVLSKIKVAEHLVAKEHEQKVGMILLYEDSLQKNITAKKSGKKYDLVELTLSDGFNHITGTIWNQDKAPDWDKNKIVYVQGVLKEGYNTTTNITIETIDVID